MHTSMVVPLIARGITLGAATLSRAEHTEPFDEADMRLAGDLASRAAVCIDNARLNTREHTTAVTLQRSLLPRHIPQVAGLQIAYRHEPASQVVVRAGGLEPPRCFHQQDLNLPRIPIAPRPLTCMVARWTRVLVTRRGPCGAWRRGRSP
jgi:GAF domain-containing protein